MMASWRAASGELTSRQAIKQWGGKHGWVIAGLLALVIFSWLHSTNKFPDPDAYYHAALAGPAVHGQLIQALPQAWFTELRDSYIDHHLLYHIILGLFVLPLGAAVGLKVASAFMAAMMVAVFHKVGRSLGIKWMWPFTALLLMSPGWLYRLGLVKATPLALIVVLIGIWLTFNRRALALGVLAWVFVYLYGGFALLPAIVSLLLIVDWLVEKYWRKNNIINSLTPRWHLGLAVWLGTLLGIVVTPNFPINLHMYFSQLIAIGVINYSLVIGVGNEWYSWGLTELMMMAGVPLLLFIITTPLAFFKKQVHTNIHISLAVLSAVVLMFTLKSQRYVEYFTPIALLGAGVILQPHLQQLPWVKFKYWFLLQEKNWRFKLCAALIIVSVSLATLGARQILLVHERLNNGSPAVGLISAYDWLKQNVAPGTLIYNVNWGDWPLLYYGAPQFRYIAGLDPTFMYRAFPELAKKYQAISRGQVSGQELVDDIIKDFGANYTLATPSSPQTNQQLEFAPGLLKVYEDTDGVVIYKNPNL